MSTAIGPRPERNVQETLRQIRERLEKQRVVESLVSRQHTQEPGQQALIESLVARQHATELSQILGRLHPADIAFVLEGLPRDERTRLWRLVPSELDGAVLLEVSDAVREGLIADMDRGEILEAARRLPSDEIADLVPNLPSDIVPELLSSLPDRHRDRVQSALTFPDGTVGALMDFDMITVREDKAIDVVLRYLRRLGHLPDHTNKLMVVDRAGVLKGTLLLNHLLTRDPELTVAQVMDRDPVFFHTYDNGREAARAFERYGLVSAPVVNAHQQLVGRLTVDAVMEAVRESTHKDMMSQVGLPAAEDLFANLWQSARNRWPWLAINLLTALIASRVIGLFEGTIEQLVALAALMPIVASIGGNTGNQAVALTIRGLALHRIDRRNARYLVLKELGISAVNGLLWGTVTGVVTYVIYGHWLLAAVMTTAMILNLLLASIVGVAIPLGLKAAGRDPAMGSSIILTFLTDAGGFFIFLGLASIVLLH